MAGVKISALPALPSIVTLADVYPLVQSGVTYKISLGELLDAVTGSDLVRLATTAALTVVYANGTAGVGATLTNGGALAALSIDGVTPSVDDRVLVKDQASGLQNGVYTVTVVGSGAVAWVMTRATDYDEAAEIDQGDMFTVGAGTANAKTQWLQTAAGPFTMGTTALTFESNVVVGIGLIKTNNTVAIDATPTAGVIFRANGSDWVASTSTFADTYAINTILYNASANTVSGLAAAQNGVLVSGNTNVPSMLAGPGTTGNILRSNAAAAPSFSTATFPSVATSTGSFMYADGTNWVASTSLWVNTVGAAGVIIRSNGTNNVYSTSTFADTYAINSIPYASAANTIAALAPALSSVMLSSAASTGVPTWSGALTNGQLIIGSTGATPAVASLTAGTGITIGTGAGSITINATGGGLATATIAGTSQTAVVNTQYIALNAGQTTVTLPGTCAVGDIVCLIGSTANTGGWILDAPVGDTIRVLTSTTSAGGTVTSTAQAGECIEVICDVADTSWVARYFVSTLLTTA